MKRYIVSLVVPALIVVFAFFSACKKNEDSNNPTGTNNQSTESCTDGVRNQDETGIDCGGAICPPCISCKDGIKNGDEEGIDCGGSVCLSCESCKDGIKNQDEFGIDCGGSVCPPCPEPTPKAQYYIKAKVEGNWIMKETDYPVLFNFGSGIGSGWSTELGLDWTMDVNYVPNDDVLMNSVLNVPIAFQDNNLTKPYPNAIFYYLPDQSYYLINQDGKVKITSFKKFDPVPSTYGDEYYDIEGTFYCKIADDQGNNIRNVTDGSFRLKVSAD